MYILLKYWRGQSAKHLPVISIVKANLPANFFKPLNIESDQKPIMIPLHENTSHS